MPNELALTYLNEFVNEVRNDAVLSWEEMEPVPHDAPSAVQRRYRVTLVAEARLSPALRRVASATVLVTERSGGVFILRCQDAEFSLPIDPDFLALEVTRIRRQLVEQLEAQTPDAP